MWKRIIAFFLLLFWVLPVFSLPESPISSIDNDLEALENLIADTLKNTEEQQQLLEGLKQNLNESGNLIEAYENIIIERENLLKSLQTHLNEMSETYRMQSELSLKYEKSSKFWRIFTMIAVPVSAGLGMWAGLALAGN